VEANTISPKTFTRLEERHSKKPVDKHHSSLEGASLVFNLLAGLSYLYPNNKKFHNSPFVKVLPPLMALLSSLFAYLIVRVNLR
jgi:hypothetical protein